MEYWSIGVLEYWSVGASALGGEPLLTLQNPSHDRADRRDAAASLVSGRLPGMTQSAVCLRCIRDPRPRVQFRKGASNRVDAPFLQATTFEHEHSLSSVATAL